MAEYNDKWEEIPDPTPVELPTGYNKPETLQQMIQRYVRAASVAASDQGFETEEEADDFEVLDDKGEFHSPYQLTDMQEEMPYVIAERGKRASGEADPGSLVEETAPAKPTPGAAQKADEKAVVTA